MEKLILKKIIVKVIPQFHIIGRGCISPISLLKLWNYKTFEFVESDVNNMTNDKMKSSEIQSRSCKDAFNLLSFIFLLSKNSYQHHNYKCWLNKEDKWAVFLVYYTVMYIDDFKVNRWLKLIVPLRSIS